MEGWDSYNALYFYLTASRATHYNFLCAARWNIQNVHYVKNAELDMDRLEIHGIFLEIQ